MFNEKEEYYPIEQPDDIPIREKEDAMGAYLMMFASIGAGLPLPVINLIASVIYYFLNRKKSRFVQFHTTQSVLSQLPVSVINSVGVFWGFRIMFMDWNWTSDFTAYIWFIVFANLSYFAFSIVAAIKARQGRMYYFLFFGRIAYDSAYKIGPNDNNSKPINKAPNF